jgi:hypothetical protein
MVWDDKFVNDFVLSFYKRELSSLLLNNVITLNYHNKLLSMVESSDKDCVNLAHQIIRKL